MTLNNRRSYLDFLRMIACFWVIFNHVRGFYAYQQSTNAVQAFYYMGYAIFAKINVPIFFMISGTLLLSKDTNYKELFMKRIVRIAGALFCASLIMYLIFVRNNRATFSTVVFLRKLLLGKHEGSYWYLYAYLGFLLSLPFMRASAKQFRHADFIVFLIVHFVLSTFLPLFNYVIVNLGILNVSISKYFSVPLMSEKAFFYPLIGYYIDQVFDISKLNRKNIWILPGVILLGIAISSCFTYHQGISSGYTQDFLDTFDYTSAISVFLLVKYIFINNKTIRECNTLHRIVSLLGSLTFGIYLFDPALKFFGKYFDAVVTTQDPILFSIIWCLFSMTAGGAITFGLKKIPLINKLL